MAKEKESRKDKILKTIVDEVLKEKADKKISKDDWIRATMMIEVLAVKEEAAKSALGKHVEAMSKEKQVIMYRKDFGKIIGVMNPLPNNPNIKEAYSQVVELECAVRRYEDLIQIVMHYGPSSLEILEPTKLKLDLGEAQGILNSVSDLIHKFVAAGVGGVIVRS
jgi:ferritin-like protein